MLGPTVRPWWECLSTPKAAEERFTLLPQVHDALQREENASKLCQQLFAPLSPSDRGALSKPRYLNKSSWHVGLCSTTNQNASDSRRQGQKKRLQKVLPAAIETASNTC